MLAAFIGLVGVVFLLVIGQNGFWSTRREELAETVVALAVLQEELGRHRDGSQASEAALRGAWKQRRKWLAIHLRPDDYRRLAASIVGDSSAAFDKPELAARLGALYDLFWEEHQAFFLVPLVHWARGNTVSKRVRTILEA